jgi:hypothetical protein
MGRRDGGGYAGRSVTHVSGSSTGRQPGGHEVGNEQIEPLTDNKTVRLPASAPGLDVAASIVRAEQSPLSR